MILPKKMSAVSAAKCRAKLELNLPTDSEDILNCGNVQCFQGGLRSAYAFEVQKYFSYFKALKILGQMGVWEYIAAEEALYGVQFEMPSTVIRENFSVVSGCFYQDRFIYSSPNVGTYSVYLWKGNKIYDVGFVSMATCSDRLFGLTDNNYLYVAPVGQMDFTESFRITPHTKLTSIVAIGKKLYALGDTCYALEPYHADDVDVVFRAISHGAGIVQTDTEVNFENKVVFATDCGLRLLQSDRVTPIFNSLNDYVSFTGSVGCAYKGKYFISCKRLDGTLEQNDITLVLDVDGEKVVGVINQGFEHMRSLGDKFYAVQNGSLLKMVETPQPVYWQKTVDFGNSYVKYLSTLIIGSRQDVNVIIQSNNEKRVYRVKGKRTLQRIPLAGSGRVFTVTIQAQNGMHVDYVELTARRYEV